MLEESTVRGGPGVIVPTADPAVDDVTTGQPWARESRPTGRGFPLTGMSSARVARVVRYGTTSAVALGISEVTLLAVYADGHVNASLAALIANLAGTVPSYLLSRYWIWRDAPRVRAGRQVVLYWITSLVCMGLTSVATGAIASIAPSGQPHHLAVVGIGFPAVNFVLWLTKYVVYQKIIFRTTPTPAR
jgi:putative flippase GtrA